MSVEVVGTQANPSTNDRATVQFCFKHGLFQRAHAMGSKVGEVHYRLQRNSPCLLMGEKGVLERRTPKNRTKKISAYFDL